MLTIPQLKHVQARDPRLAEALEAIVKAVNAIGGSIGVDPTGLFPAPKAPALLNVQASNGWFDIAVTDPGAQFGAEYFVDYDTNPSFGSPSQRTIHLGPSRTKYTQLGNFTLYFRCYSQFRGSLASAFTYFGTAANPTAVTGGGSSGPAPQPSTGSGSGPGGGFGTPRGGDRRERLVL